MKTFVIKKKTVYYTTCICMVLLYLTIVKPYLYIYLPKEKDDTFVSFPFLICILIACVFLHEIIHYLFFVLFSGSKKNVKLEFVKKYLYSPGCYCSSPVKCWQYQIAVISPSIILGVIPVICGYVFINSTYITIGVTMFLGSTADIMLYVYTLKLKISPNSLVQDMHKNLGFYYE
jgi:hypothetical protein